MGKSKFTPQVSFLLILSKLQNNEQKKYPFKHAFYFMVYDIYILHCISKSHSCYSHNTYFFFYKELGLYWSMLEVRPTSQFCYHFLIVWNRETDDHSLPETRNWSVITFCGILLNGSPLAWFLYIICVIHIVSNYFEYNLYRIGQLKRMTSSRWTHQSLRR